MSLTVREAAAILTSFKDPQPRMTDEAAARILTSFKKTSPCSKYLHTMPEREQVKLRIELCIKDHFFWNRKPTIYNFKTSRHQYKVCVSKTNVTWLRL